MSQGIQKYRLFHAITISTLIDCINIAERKIKETEAPQEKELEMIGKFKRALEGEINEKLK